MGKFTSTFFEPDALEQFTIKVQTYWNEKYPEIESGLTRQELKQLMWLQVNATTTPQASTTSLKSDLNYEIKRALARLAGFQLLIANSIGSYPIFANLRSNSTDLLSEESFIILADQLQDLSESEKVSLRITCFFTLSDLAKTRLQNQRVKYTNDSEIFLSEMSLLSVEELKALFPLFKQDHINDTVLSALQSAYWPGAHARHFYYLEGKDLGIPIQALKQRHVQAVRVWEMRWWLNLFGFNPSQAVTQTLFNQWEPLFTDLNQHPETALQNHFARVMALTLDGLTIPADFTDEDKRWVAHLAWFYTKGQLSIEERQGIVDSYARIKTTATGQSLLQNYNNFLTSSTTPTPTYTPALFTRVYEVIKNNPAKFTELLQQNAFMPGETGAAAAAAYFTSLILHDVYHHAVTGNRLISCYLITQPPKVGETDQLEVLLTGWLENNLQLAASADMQGNIVAAITAPSLSSSHSMGR